MKDKCIICGRDTQYDMDTHIDFRLNYIEGAGQLCDDCVNISSKTSPNTTALSHRNGKNFTIKRNIVKLYTKLCDGVCKIPSNIYIILSLTSIFAPFTIGLMYGVRGGVFNYIIGITIALFGYGISVWSSRIRHRRGISDII
jgi:uncharacterized protein YlaI